MTANKSTNDKRIHVHFTSAAGATTVKVEGHSVAHEEVTIENDTRFGETVVVIRARSSAVVIHGVPEDDDEQ